MQHARIALILLAAGQSRRFGGNKLAVPLAGEPLLRRTARAFAGLPFAERIAVTGPDSPDLSDLGFRCVPLDPPGGPQSASIAQGLAAVADGPAEAVMIALGDMPLISAAHVGNLLAAYRGQTVASACSGVAMPPAIFPRARFAELAGLQGDRGARALLAGSDLVVAPDGELIDIDVPADLDRIDRI